MIDYIEKLSSPVSLQKLEIYKKEVLDNPTSFPPLFELIFQNNDKFSWKAAWLTEKIITSNKSLISDEMKIQLMDFSSNIKNSSLKRAVLAIFVKLSLPKKIPVSFINLSLDRVISTTEATAVQAYSMKILLKIATEIPEFIPEFIAILENLDYNGQSAGFRTMRKNALQNLRKISLKKR